jgi:rSAM/selenodomain-associated transferase 1
MSDAQVQVVVIAKAPAPGKVKTRLCPPLTWEEAADVARAALMDTLDAVLATPAAARTVVLDGKAGRWLPADVNVIPQRSGPFGDRLAGAIEDAYAALPVPVLLVGMDTPQLQPDHLDEAANALLADGTDAVLGLAEDGGFWIIGSRRPVPGMFTDVPMSTALTGTRQRARLGSLGLRCTELTRLRDVDVLGDALAVARDAPRTRFAATLGSCLKPRGMRETVSVD